MRVRRAAFRVHLPVILAVVMGLVLAACGDGGPYVPAGIVRTPAPAVGGIMLPDVTNGGDMSFRANPGGALIVYWGYTSCPDVCPTTMVEVRNALSDLGDLADSVDVAVITADPNRDTAEVFIAYVETFVVDGIAVRTEDPVALEAAADPFGVTYLVTTREDGWIDVVHTGFL